MNKVLRAFQFGRVKEKTEAKDQPKPSSFAAKDWVALTFSVGAFVLSLAVAYFTTFQITDNVSVVIEAVPRAQMEKENTVTVDPGEITFIFINAGTRAAAIRDASIVFAQPKEAGLEGCEPGPDQPTALFRLDLPTFTLKEKEVVTKVARIIPSEEGTLNVPLADFNAERAQFWIATCFGFTLSTASVASHASHVYRESYRVEKGKRLSQREINLSNTIRYILFDPRKPYELIHERGNIIWNN